ncbi:MAG TPA: CbtA family protein [Acidimicrobiales bacterium]|nr:CbtA family protein [Acidimicrobiales bacterium]
MIRDGALAGLAGGAALAVVLVLLGEESIGRAIALEQGDGGEMFSRGTQTAGGVLAALVWGAALGVVFAFVFPVARRRLATASDWRAAVGLAVLGFLTVNLVPFLKYTPNPPGVGDPDTIGRRTALYLLLLAWAALAAAAAWAVGRRLADDPPALPEHLRAPAVVAVYVVVVATGFVGLPGSPDPVTAPAALVWRFRLASLAGTAAFWAVCGVAFGWLRLAAAGRSPFSSRGAPSRAGATGEP